MEQDLSRFSTLRDIVARLRGPGGCPWDRQQTHASLKPFLLEEAYEVLEALDGGDMAKLREELGDLLLQILLHSQIASEDGSFDVGDVIRGLAEKLIHRHPHVFGGTEVSGAEEVVVNWEELKRQEKQEDSLLAGVPKQLPALAYSQAIQGRAARAGFDWERLEGILEKLAEEVGELEGETTHEGRLQEFGDLLFTLANYARRLGVDLEEGLHLSNERFCRRGLSFERLSFQEQNALWEEAKKALS
jgi:tetrapyrrole methylase family protein/MazG family protein